MPFQGRVPAEVNHFRVGEGLLFCCDLIVGERFDRVRDDVFRLPLRRPLDDASGGALANEHERPSSELR